MDNNSFEDKQNAWNKRNDAVSIGCVFDILPEKFMERIEAGAFDKSLLVAVKGGDYEVPLYYVTKAWDVLLKNSLGVWSFMIGPEEDEDFSEEALKRFLKDEGATRSRGQAVANNDRMKAVWKEKFDIDIDGLDVDFAQFNMRIPPNVSRDDFYWYFQDVPNGIMEWVLCGINHPTGVCSFDSVSSLMEFAALVVLDKSTHFMGYFD